MLNLISGAELNLLESASIIFLFIFLDFKMNWTDFEWASYVCFSLLNKSRKYK